MLQRSPIGRVGAGAGANARARASVRARKGAEIWERARARVWEWARVWACARRAQDEGEGEVEGWFELSQSGLDSFSCSLNLIINFFSRDSLVSIDELARVGQALKWG